eukprot:GFYU01013374.1.p1 GENE.GFYU01013374.1~~GFYU01013374.1.p1  ORF type:complete len:303 (-),score=67.69 GFYU01013374.1:149-949(-)
MSLSSAFKSDLLSGVQKMQPKLEQNDLYRESLDWDVITHALDKRLAPYEYKLENGKVVTIAQNNQCTGTILWTATIQMAKYMEHHHHPNGANSLADKNVMELGCGTGFLGIVTAAQGAQCVLTDLPDVIGLTKENVSNNSNVITTPPGDTIILPYTWGETDVNTFKQQLSDERKSKGLGEVGEFDLVIACEVIYTKELVQPLLDTLLAVTGPSTRVLYAADTRGREGVKLFFEKAKEFFTIEDVPHSECHPKYHTSLVIMVEMRRK